jgi:hypothetical protein
LWAPVETSTQTAGNVPEVRHRDRNASMIQSDDEISAYHECGHCIFAELLGMPVRSITINPPACCTLTLRGVLTIMFDEDKRAIFFLSGMMVQQFYYSEVPITSKNDQVVLWGLPEHRRKTYESFIRKHLADPVIQRKIEDLAARLITELSIDL